MFYETPEWVYEVKDNLLTLLSSVTVEVFFFFETNFKIRNLDLIFFAFNGGIKKGSNIQQIVSENKPNFKYRVKCNDGFLDCLRKLGKTGVKSISLAQMAIQSFEKNAQMNKIGESNRTGGKR